MNSSESKVLWQIQMIQHAFQFGMRLAAKTISHFHILWDDEVVLHWAPCQYFTGLG